MQLTASLLSNDSEWENFKDDAEPSPLLDICREHSDYNRGISAYHPPLFGAYQTWQVFRNQVFRIRETCPESEFYIIPSLPSEGIRFTFKNIANIFTSFFTCFSRLPQRERLPFYVRFFTTLVRFKISFPGFVRVRELPNWFAHRKFREELLNLGVYIDG
ncbi:hypothetical protein EG329_013158 [Mollisiaceae sp. DMI_Dod_QoI]|nr:hypothetical protein EG329_013158 [Helotiales sp. DMI_Dod_QoI]